MSKKYICNNASKCKEFCKHKSIHERDDTCDNKCPTGDNVKCIEMKQMTDRR